jgi:hypothetical protein
VDESRYLWSVIRRLPLLMLLCGALRAGDPHLEALRTILLPMRAKQPSETSGPRGATPQLTVAKHLLLDWLEFRLGSVGEGFDGRELQRSLTLELLDAGLS